VATECSNIKGGAAPHHEGELQSVTYPNMETPFFVNTAMLCYNCRRVAILRLNRSRRKISVYKQEEEVLDIVFVSCSACINQGAHQPLTSLLPKHIDPLPYIPITSELALMYGCTPCLEKFPKFSITAFCFKMVMRVYDTGEIFHIKDANVLCIKILDHGIQIHNDCGFFDHTFSWEVPTFDGSNYKQPAPLSQVKAASVLCARCNELGTPPPQYTQVAEKSLE
jgi:hypothetical protein